MMMRNKKERKSGNRKKKIMAKNRNKKTKEDKVANRAPLGYHQGRVQVIPHLVII